MMARGEYKTGVRQDTAAAAHAPAAATAWRCEALYKLGSKKGCDAPISIHLPGGRQIDSSRSRLCRSRIYGLGHYVFSLIIVLTGGNSR